MPVKTAQQKIEGVRLSDVIMVKKMGAMEGLQQAIDQGRSVQEFMDSVRDRVTVQDVAERSLEMNITAQFGGDPLTPLRELGQNALDSYKEGTENRKVDFTVSDATSETILTVQDYGEGIPSAEIIDLLLTPYVSSKREDRTKTGEHGVGWFSIMDVSKEVRVLTVTDDEATMVRVYKDAGEWRFDVSFNVDEYYDESAELPKGTTVILKMKEEYGAKKVKRTIEKQMNLVSEENDVGVEYNGEREKINTGPGEFGIGGRARLVKKVGGKEAEGALSLRIRSDTLDGKTIITQNGLLVSEGDNPFKYYTIEHSILEMLTESGMQVWVDLPPNIGLTQSRSEVFAADREKAYAALGVALQDCFINVVLTDPELLKKMDNKVVELISKMLTGSMGSDAALRGMSKASEEGYSRKKSQQVVGRDFFVENYRGAEAGPSRIEVEKPGGEKLVIDVSGFVAGIMDVKAIPAVVIENSEKRETTVSLRELIEAYKKNQLKTMEDRMIGDGLYVDQNNPLAKAFANVLREAERSGYALQRIASESGETLAISHTPLEVFQEIEKRTGLCAEYVAFLEVCEYFDKIIEDAAGVQKSLGMFHMTKGQGDIAHTNRQHVSFNLATSSWPVFAEHFLQGEVDDETVFNVLDTYIHEKAHVWETHAFAHSAEGEEHYRWKLRLQNLVINYCIQQGIDIEKDVNDIIAKHQVIKAVDIDTLAELIEQVEQELEKEGRIR